MKRAGFTMIELIFVIVILGILSAVALPKFIGVAEQAQVGKMKAYVGSLNRTVAPALWSDSISLGDAGSLISAANTARFTASLAASLPPLEDIADDGSDVTAIALSVCAVSTTVVPSVGGAAPATGQTAASVLIGGKTYVIGCVNGSGIQAPSFWLEENSIVLVK